MDILRKMFKLGEEKEDKNVRPKDEFRKPHWFEEAETDDELFDDDRKFVFQIFKDAMEMQKTFERQMQQGMEAGTELDGEIKLGKPLNEELLQPGFDERIMKELEKQSKRFMDNDLDGEIFPDQLHGLMQRLSPKEDNSSILPRNDSKSKRFVPSKKRYTDEELILGRIHGTIVDDEARPRLPRPRPDMMTPVAPMVPRTMQPFGGGSFEGTFQGPKMYSQSVVTKTVRKPDGSYETTKVTEDCQGNRTRTVTRSVDGKTETVTTYDNATGAGTIKQKAQEEIEVQVYSDRNIAVSRDGYAVPRNIW